MLGTVVAAAVVAVLRRLHDSVFYLLILQHWSRLAINYRKLS
jgi:hypothetical protein